MAKPKATLALGIVVARVGCRGWLGGGIVTVSDRPAAGVGERLGRAVQVDRSEYQLTLHVAHVCLNSAADM